MGKFILLITLILTIWYFNNSFLNNFINYQVDKYYNFTGTTLNYCQITDFSGNIYTGGCYDTIFVPSKVYSGDTIYLTGERINNGIIYNWKYGQFGDACYSGDDIQGEIIDCGIN